MRNLIRPIVGVLSTLLVVSLLGCSSRPKEEVLEVAVFQGGYGIDFFERKAREFEQKFPEKLTPEGASAPLKIKLWGSPRVWEQLRPRFVQGDVPDLTWPGWGMDYWKLVSEKQVLPMDEFLTGKAWDQDKPWQDTFNKDLLDKGRYEGKYYIIPFNNNLFSWWYNSAMFKKQGWTPPRTYPELLALCEKIKKTGIEPITYQGKYPDYALRGLFYPWAISVGGIEAYWDAQDLKPGAWKGPAFLKAAEMIAELRDKGYFAKGALGKTHTQAQSDFVAGKAAFIPCGTWLASEQKDEIAAHPEFSMEFMLTPMVPGGKGDPTALNTGTEDWIITNGAKYPEIAAEFFKFLTSLENSKEWVKEKQTFTCIEGSEKVELPKHLATAAKLYSQSNLIYTSQASQWYPGLKDGLEDAMRRLLNGDVTPKQCVELMEQTAAKVRADAKVIKHKVERTSKPAAP